MKSCVQNSILPRAHLGQRVLLSTPLYGYDDTRMISQYKLTVLLIFILGLVACDQQAHDYRYYLSHPKEIARLEANCVNTPLSTQLQQQCQSVRKARILLTQMMLKMRANPQGFGLALLRLQMQKAATEKSLAETRNQLADMKRRGVAELNIEKHLTNRQTLLIQQRDLQEQEIQAHYAVIRLIQHAE